MIDIFNKAAREVTSIKSKTPTAAYWSKEGGLLGSIKTDLKPLANFVEDGVSEKNGRLERQKMMTVDGEGGGFAQALGPVSNWLINDVWYWATEEALEKVTGRKYSVNGKDWNENN